MSSTFTNVGFAEFRMSLKNLNKDSSAFTNFAISNQDDRIKFGIKFGISDKQILLALHSAPSSTAAEIAQRMGISQRAVEKQMKKFKDLGIIHREGSRKNGLWVINIGRLGFGD